MTQPALVHGAETLAFARPFGYFFPSSYATLPNFSNFIFFGRLEQVELGHGHFPLPASGPSPNQSFPGFWYRVSRDSEGARSYIILSLY